MVLKKCKIPSEHTFAAEQSLVLSSYLMRPHSAFRMLHLMAQSWIVAAVKFATGLVRPAQASNLNTKYFSGDQ